MAFAPTEPSGTDVKDTRTISPHDVVTILGDFNAATHDNVCDIVKFSNDVLSTQRSVPYYLRIIEWVYVLQLICVAAVAESLVVCPMPCIALDRI